MVNVNPLYTPRELEHQLKDSGAAAIVIVENFAHTLQEVLDRTPVKTIVTTQLGDLFLFPSVRWSTSWSRTSREWCRPGIFQVPCHFGGAGGGRGTNLAGRCR